MEKEKTGYPHIDKPWMKYYDRKLVDMPLPKMTMYEYLVEMNKKNLDMVATDFYGSKLTYGEMLEKIDEAARGLTYIGVSKQDRVLEILPTLPTTAHIMYANSKIGGVSVFYDPRPDSINAKVNGKKLLEIIKKEKIKHLIIFEQCYIPFISQIENELKELGIDKVVLVSSNDSMTLKGKLGFLLDELDKSGLKALKEKIANMKKTSAELDEYIKKSPLQVLKYSELVERSKNVLAKKNDYTPDELSLIVHTSGTTGAMPKPIPLTNDNLNSHVHQIIAAGGKFEKGASVFQLLPYFASFGIADVAHFGFCCGSKMIQIPEFTPQDLPRRIYKEKPNMIIVAPAMLNSLLESKYLDKKDLSFIRRIVVGGDTFAMENEVKELLESHNAGKCRLEKGHGMSEYAGSGSIAFADHNPIGGIGTPLPYTTYAIMNPVTNKPIKFEDGKDVITGEAWVSSPCVTPGVLDGETIIPRYELDGETYIKTGDLINMRRDGNMFFDSRIDRTFARFDGYKYKPYVIEKILMEDERIAECVIVPYSDYEKNGYMPIAHVVLNSQEYTLDEQYDILREIIEEKLIHNPEVSTRQIPTKIKVRSSIPLTKNSKNNFRELKGEGIDGSEFTIVIPETNISVGEITIEKPNYKKPYIKL